MTGYERLRANPERWAEYLRRRREVYAKRMADPVNGAANRERHREKVRRANRKLAATGHLTRYMREKRRTDLAFRLADNLRRRLNEALHGKRKHASVMLFLGCSVDELRRHLESGFVSGMSWANYGVGRGKWSIDHIKPCVLFDLRNKSEQQECFHWKNLQPLWCVDNVSKGCRMAA